MPTTTIRLPEELKARVADAAERTGSSAHAFILEAIAEKAERAERQAAFRDEAESRYERIAQSGETVPWSAMRTHLQARVVGERTVRPGAKRIAR